MENIQARIADNVNIIQNLKKILRESNKPITKGEKLLLFTLYRDNTQLSQELLDIEKKKRKLAELVDDPQIEVRFIKACEKQIEDAKRQLRILGGDKSEELK